MEMIDEFFDWLNDCPVQWVRTSDEEEDVGYRFIKPVEDDHEETTGEDIDEVYDQMRDDKMKLNVAPDEDPTGEKQENFCN